MLPFEFLLAFKTMLVHNVQWSREGAYVRTFTFGGKILSKKKEEENKKRIDEDRHCLPPAQYKPRILPRTLHILQHSTNVVKNVIRKRHSF